jgi:UDP-glucose 4-epimerase
VLRLTNTYGPAMRVKDDRQTFLGTWLRLAVLGEELAIFGDGSQRRDFTYVDDAVEAFLLAAEREEADGEVFNLGGDESISLLELAELLVELAPEASFRLVPFPDERLSIDIGDYVANDVKIRERLGWAPSVGLREGLARSLDYYRAHAKAYW